MQQVKKKLHDLSDISLGINQIWYFLPTLSLESLHSIMLTKALMKGHTMLQALINLGGMKKVWTAACLVVVAWLGLGLATILAGKELKETMVMVTVTFCSRDLVIGDWLVVTDRIQSRPETLTKVFY